MLFVVTIAFLIYSVLILQLARGLARLETGMSRRTPKVSIIVAARNEALLLPFCLQALSRQKYPGPHPEIVLVNDRSTDRTGEIMTEFQARHPDVQVLHLTEETVPAPKKRALSHAIAQSAGEILLFTDADCQPPATWVHEMVRHFTPGVALVAGFSPLKSPVKSIWNGIIELDSLVAATTAAGSIGLGHGLTCTGRNLAYTRKIYETVAGFSAISQSLSGDDDLFLQQVQQRTGARIRYAVSPAARVPAQPVPGLRSFIFQRRRHISAGKYFSRKTQLLYFGYHLSNFSIFGGCFILLWRGHWQLSAAVLALKFLTDFSVLHRFAKQSRYRKPLKYFFFWEFYFLGLNSLLGPTSFFGKIHWK